MTVEEATPSTTPKPATTTPPTRPRRLTGLTPSGRLHLGNLVGAIRPMIALQDRVDSVILVTDLHAMTIEHDPGTVSAMTTGNAAVLLAAGLDPDATTFCVQSHVPEHTELHYLLECVTAYGEARRMIQFKEKASKQAQVRLSLLTYPVLMAADILLYDTTEVPVGADQTQHVELARDVATRFNHRYGDTFVVPRAVNPEVAARVMDLAEPTAKMAKSGAGSGGALYLLDPPDVLRRKVMRAVTDSDPEIRYDPVAKPGASNLLDILAVLTGRPISDLVGQFTGYGELKAAVAETVVATLAPIQQRYRDLDPAYVDGALRRGAQRARERAAGTVGRAKRAIGLLPSSNP